MYDNFCVDCLCLVVCLADWSYSRHWQGILGCSAPGLPWWDGCRLCRHRPDMPWGTLFLCYLGEMAGAIVGIGWESWYACHAGVPWWDSWSLGRWRWLPWEDGCIWCAVGTWGFLRWPPRQGTHTLIPSSLSGWWKSIYNGLHPPLQTWRTLSQFL